jgi:hypothetical protein
MNGQSVQLVPLVVTVHEIAEINVIAESEVFFRTAGIAGR